jgi:hypothetical protein
MLMLKPKFCNEHLVSFAGGEGIVRRANWECDRWTYLVEMALGEEPEFGRIGPETMVLLDETDLYTNLYIDQSLH